jgi:hypothetical protein
LPYSVARAVDVREIRVCFCIFRVTSGPIWDSTLVAIQKQLMQKLLVTIFIGSLGVLFSASAQAGSATWKLSPGSSDWNTNSNWTPNTGYPNGSSDVATFDLSDTTSVGVSGITQVNGIVFDSAASAFTITVNPSVALTVSGAGITNNSGITENFVTAVNGSGGAGGIAFSNSATAGSMTVFVNNGATVSGDTGGGTAFLNTSTAGSATFTNNAGTVAGANGGFTGFHGSASAAGGTFTNNGGTVNSAGGGGMAFFDTSTAGSGTFTNNGSTAQGASGGFIIFENSASAAGGTFTNNGGTIANGANGGRLEFDNFSTAGSAIVTNNAGTAFGAGSGFTTFKNNSTAGSGTFTNNGAGVSGADGGFTVFSGSSTAASSTLINNAGTVSGAVGGVTQFGENSTAGTATLIANGGTGAGGSIQFFGDTSGGTATVKVFGNGNLDISSHNPLGLQIASLEGSGNVFLGANELDLISNSSKTFSGIIQDGGIGGGTGGSLNKDGTGSVTLSGANTYSGGTVINGGLLFVNNTTGSGTGTNSVTVNNVTPGGSTLGGSGTISGAVTVMKGTTPDTGTLAPGVTGNGSTAILNIGGLMLNPGTNFSIDLNGNIAGANYDRINVTGTVTITGSNLLLNSVSGLTPGDHLFIIENDGTDAITGTFSGLANGAMFSSGGDTFQIFYDATGQGGGNDIELTVISAVPESSTFVHAALACLVIVYMKRRRFAQMLRRT